MEKHFLLGFFLLIVKDVCDHDRSQTIADMCFYMIADDRRTFCDLRSAIIWKPALRHAIFKNAKLISASMKWPDKIYVFQIRINCIVLYCTALHCTALHCTALHCTALHCTALHCPALPCPALPYPALHCTALHCIALCSAVLCRAVLHCTVRTDQSAFIS